MKPAYQQISQAGDVLAARIWAMPYPLFATLIFAYMVLVNGLWIVPSAHFPWLISQDLTQNPFAESPENSWLLTSYLQPALLHLLHLNATPMHYVAGAFALLLAGYATVTALLRTWLGSDAGRSALLLFTLLPLSNVMLTWIGYPDALSWVLTTLILLCPQAYARLGLMAALTLNHQEQALVLIPILALSICLLNTERRPAGQLALLAFGWALGWGIFHGHLYLHDITIAQSRAEFASTLEIRQLVGNLLAQPQMLIISLFGIGWAVMIPLMLQLKSSTTSQRRRWVIALLIALAPVPMVLDQTRVFAILSWPIALAMLLHIWQQKEECRPHLRRLLALCALAGLFVPRIIYWDGQTHSTTLPYTLALVSDLTLGTEYIDRNVDGWALRPFHKSP